MKPVDQSFKLRNALYLVQENVGAFMFGKAQLDVVSDVPPCVERRRVGGFKIQNDHLLF